jgi:hypothetical protein
MNAITDTYRDLVAQGKTSAQAVRTIAWSLYGSQSDEAKSFMAGYRASITHGDNLETREAKHAQQYGNARGNAYSMGWVLAACVA